MILLPLLRDLMLRHEPRGSPRRLPGRAGGYPTVPPIDPNVPYSGIRFLDSQSLSTTLTQSLAALQTPSDGVDDSGCW
jgi:hypothetical protein